MGDTKAVVTVARAREIGAMIHRAGDHIEFAKSSVETGCADEAVQAIDECIAALERARLALVLAYGLGRSKS